MLDDLPADDHVFFSVRDPAARYVSAFHSRLNKGQPRYHYEWTPLERKAFEAFPTPQRLAAALVSEDEAQRRLARRAMGSIRHFNATVRSLRSRRALWARRHQIVYIAHQETLSADWEQIKLLLELPPDAKLPTGRRAAHRSSVTTDPPLDQTAADALRRWYRIEYQLVAYCEQMRAWNGWGLEPRRPDRGAGFRREVRRLTGLPAVIPPPPEALRLRHR